MEKIELYLKSRYIYCSTKEEALKLAKKFLLDGFDVDVSIKKVEK